MIQASTMHVTAVWSCGVSQSPALQTEEAEPRVLAGDRKMMQQMHQVERADGRDPHQVDANLGFVLPKPAGRGPTIVCQCVAHRTRVRS